MGSEVLREYAWGGSSRCCGGPVAPSTSWRRRSASTDNGVRAHLATLERDGIARQRGTVSRGAGGGKPAYVYELTPEAEDLFPKAYGPVLRRLLDVMVERLGPEETEALLRAVGRHIADERTVPAAGVRAQSEVVIAVLTDLCRSI